MVTRRPQTRLQCKWPSTSYILIPWSNKPRTVYIVDNNTDDRTFSLIPAGAGSRDQNSDAILGKFEIVTGLTILFEPFHDGFSVRSEYTHAQQNLQSLPIRKSTRERQCIIYLRPDDVVLMNESGLEVYVILEDGSNATTPVNSESEVQVKSSNPEMKDNAADVSSRRLCGNEKKTSESDSDDPVDLDKLRHPGTANDMPETMMFTPQRRVSKGATLVVEDTPKQAVVENEDQLYSTAQEDHSSQEPAQSPSIRSKIAIAARRSPQLSTESQDRAGDSLLKSCRLDLQQEKASRAAINKMYGRQNRKINMQITSQKMPSTDGPGENESHGGSDEDEDPTSAPDEGRPTDAEEISAQDGVDKRFCDAKLQRNSGSKRKMRPQASEEDGAEDEAISTTKRQKTNSPNADDSPNGVDSNEPTPHATASTTQSKISRLPKAAEREDESNEDDITVTSKAASSKAKKRKPSPMVVVQPSTTNTNTPTSTPTKISKVVLSRITISKATQNWLKTKGIQAVKEVPSHRSQFVCIVDTGDLKKTPKVLRSLIAGKPVVTEDWLGESQAADEILDVQDFIHPDLEGEIVTDRGKLFVGKTLRFTNALVQQYQKAGWAEIQAIAKDAGASSVSKCQVAKDGPIGSGGEDEDEDGDRVIFFGADDGDAVVASLVRDYGRKVFRKDLLTHSIITGELDLGDEEFRLSGAEPAEKKKRGKRSS